MLQMKRQSPCNGSVWLGPLLLPWSSLWLLILYLFHSSHIGLSDAAYIFASRLLIDSLKENLSSSNIPLPVRTFMLLVSYKHRSPSYHMSHSHILTSFLRPDTLPSFTSLLKCRFPGEVFSDHLIKMKPLPIHPILFTLYYVSLFP